MGRSDNRVNESMWIDLICPYSVLSENILILRLSDFAVFLGLNKDGVINSL